MASYSVRLDGIKIAATANPHPNLDYVVVAMSLERWGWDGSKFGRLQVLGGQIGYIGRLGKGEHPISPEHTFNSVGWELDVPELDNPSDQLKLVITARNARQLNSREIERIVANFGYGIAGLIVGHQIGSVVADAAIFVLGEFVDALVDEELPDRPACRGRVFDHTMLCSTSLIDTQLSHAPDSQKFGTINPSTAAHVVSTWSWLQSEDLEPLASGCGTPFVEIKQTLIRKTSLQFGPVVKFAHAYTEATDAAPSDIAGNWVEVDSVSSVTPRVFVSVRQASNPNVDGVDVTVVERIFDGNKSWTVVEKTFNDVPISRAQVFLPGKDVFGEMLFLDYPSIKRHVSAGVGSGFNRSAISRMAGTATVELAARPEVRTASSALLHEAPLKVPQEVSAPPELVEAASNPSSLVRFMDLRSIGLEDGYIALLMRYTPCLELPNGTVISIWQCFTKEENGKVLASSLALRYDRPGNLRATTTDAWLSRHSPVK